MTVFWERKDIMVKKDFAVIGLGTFGRQLCKELSDKGANVLALDIDEERVNEVAAFIPQAFCCDCSKEEVLKKLDLGTVDHVIIAIGKNFDAAILITVLLKELGVQKLTVRAEDEYAKKILLRLGADETVNTQELAVSNLCEKLLDDSVKAFYQIGKDYGVATLSFSGKEPSASLAEMNLRTKYALNVLLIKRGGEIISPTAKEHFEPGDSVVVFGKKSAIKKMGKEIS